MLHKIVPGATPDPVTAKPGDELEVHLAETPTTGYQWTFDTDSSGPFDLKGAHYAPHDPSAVGGSGSRVFQFAVTGPGSGTLRFINQRSWGGERAKRFEIAVEST